MNHTKRLDKFIKNHYFNDLDKKHIKEIVKLAFAEGQTSGLKTSTAILDKGFKAIIKGEPAC